MIKEKRGMNEISTEAICVFNKHSQVCVSGLKSAHLDHIDSLPLSKESKQQHLLVSYNFKRAFNGRFSVKSQFRAKQTTIVLDFDNVGTIDSEDSLIFESEFRIWNVEFMDSGAFMEVSASGTGRHITIVLGEVLTEDEFSEFVKGIIKSLSGTFLEGFIDVGASSSIHRNFYDTHLFRNRVASGLINSSKASQKTIGFWTKEALSSVLCKLKIFLVISQESSFTDEKRYRYRLKARELAYKILRNDSLENRIKEETIRLFADDLLDEWNKTANGDPVHFYKSRVPFIVNKAISSDAGRTLLINAGFGEIFNTFRFILDEDYADSDLLSGSEEKPEFRIKEDGEHLTLSKIFGSKSNSGVVDLVDTISFCMEKSGLNISSLRNAMGFSEEPSDKKVKRTKINTVKFLECVLEGLSSNRFLNNFRKSSMTSTACYQILDFLLYSAQSNEVRLKNTIEVLCIILSVFNSQIAEQEIGRPFYEVIKQRVRKAKGIYAEEAVTVLTGVREKFTETSKNISKGVFYTGKSLLLNEVKTPELLNCIELMLEEIRITVGHIGKKYRFGMHKLRRYISLTNSNQYTVLRNALMSYLSEGTDGDYVPHYKCKEYILKDFVISLTETKSVSQKKELKEAVSIFRESLGVGGNTYETIRRLSRMIYDACEYSVDLTISVIHDMLDSAAVNELESRKKEVSRFVSKIDRNFTGKRISLAA